MHCARCDFVNPAEMSYCGRCGAALTRPCPRCGRTSPPGFVFCGHCGAALDRDAGAASAGGGTIGSHRLDIPDALAEKVRAVRGAVAGRRLPVTIFYADVRDLSDAVAGSAGGGGRGEADRARATSDDDTETTRHPELTRQLLDMLADGVHRFEGVTQRVGSNALFALFGAPIPHTDHVRRAGHAALYLRDAARRSSDEVRRTHGVSLCVRIALSSGEITLDVLAPDLRASYTPHGDTIRVAELLHTLVHPGSIYVAPTTASLASAHFRLRDLGVWNLPEAGAQIHVHELEHELPASQRLVAAAPSSTPLVARASEIGALEEALERARSGQLQIVGVSGDAGVGKTRLCQELADLCRSRGIPVTTSRCLPLGRWVPFHFLLGALRDYFGIYDDDGAEVARDKIARRMLRVDGRLAADLPFMMDFLGVPDAAGAPIRLGPERRRRNLRRIVARLVDGSSDTEPVVIIADDLHWIDGASEAVLGSPPASARCLIVCTFEPGYEPPWASLSSYQPMRLSPLAPSATDELIAVRLGAAAEAPAVRTVLRERSGGNPLYVFEGEALLRETGVIEADGEGKRTASPRKSTREALELALPDSLAGLIGARIDRLGRLERAVLETAAVIGPAGPVALLETVVGVTDAELRDALDSLAHAGIVHLGRLYPEAELSFSHPLVQDVVYRAISGDRRVVLHRALAGELERRHTDRLDEKAGLLAYHCENAEQFAEAARWHRRAAEWSGASSPTECARHWRRVDELAARLPETPETLALAATACARILWYGTRAGTSAYEAADLYHRGEEMARRSANFHALAGIQNSYGVARYYAGHVRDSLELLTDAIRTADELRDPALRAATRSSAMLALLQTQRVERSLKVAEEVLSICDGDVRLGRDVVSHSPYLLAIALRARALRSMGRLREAREQLERVGALIETHGDITVEALVLSESVWLCRAQGSHSALTERALEYTARVEDDRNVIGQVVGHSALGFALLLDAQHGEALEELEWALELARTHRTLMQYEPFIATGIAQAGLGLGQIGRARSEAEHAAANARDRGTRDLECEAQLVRARILREIDGPAADAQIETALDRASWLVERTGHQVHQAAIREERARLADLRGDEPTSERELREAHRMFIRMDAWGHAERLAVEIAR